MPAESVTVTFLGSRLATLEATRWTIDCTWLVLSVAPGWVPTSTAAVTGAVSVSKSFSCGIATCTTAVSTESSASMVLSSSPSVARLKVICSCDCDWSRLPCLSSSE